MTQMKNALQKANWGNISGQLDLPFAILMALPMVRQSVTITINLTTAHRDDEWYHVISTAIYPIISPKPTQPTPALVLDELLSGVYGRPHAPEKFIEINTCI